MSKEDILSILESTVIVSVQAQDNEPLNKPEHLLALCQSVISGGASALRLCGVENINYISKKVSAPIIGLTKVEPTPINFLDTVYISASMQDVESLINTSADIIALDGTPRKRIDGSSLKEQIDLVKKSGKIVLCDISTYDEGLVAIDLGADMLSTTLSGYTRQTRKLVNEGPDLDLLADLCEECDIPVIMEGRIWEPEEVKEAFELGAFAVVIGTAITRPQKITKRFISAIPEKLASERKS